MPTLRELNIVIGQDTQAAKIFENLFEGRDFTEIAYQTPSEYIKIYWDKYCQVREELIPNDQTRRGVNGKIFEYIIATLLVREHIYPIYMSAKVAFVPNINYDLLLYSTDQGPICLSAKTSFRERYKQADLEAIALKYVHRKSKAYLLTLSENDAKSVNEKQRIGDVIGLDSAIYTLSEVFDDLIKEIKSYHLTTAPIIHVVNSNQVVSEEILQKHIPEY